LDPQVLNKLKFKQSSDRKNWQGLNVLFSGVPGTSVHLNGRDILYFKEEKEHVEALEKVLDLATQMFSLSCPSAQAPTNQNAIRFSFTEKLKTNKDEKGRPLYDDYLLEKVNAVVASQT
jgi:hypothetical protein